MGNPQDFSFSDMDLELMASEEELVCPICKHNTGKDVQLGILCTAHKGGPGPFPCGCEGTDYYGSCKCDVLCCPHCGYVPMESTKSTMGEEAAIKSVANKNF